MSHFAKFKVYNFNPRADVIDKMNYILEEIAELVPNDSNCTAIVEKVKDHFIFEITIRAYNRVFYCKYDINVRAKLCRERLWQVEVASLLYNEMKKQIENYQQRPFAA